MIYSEGTVRSRVESKKHDGRRFPNPRHEVKQSKGFPVHTIITHEHPHIDELYAIWLLVNFGEEKYPGVRNAGVEFCNSQNPTYEEGELLVGIGGGRFDEHPDGNKARKKNHCAATLVARDLGLLQREPQIKQMLDYVCENDLNGAKHKMELGNMAKILNLYGNDPQMVVSVCFNIFDADNRKQMQFFSADKDLERADVIKVRWQNRVRSVVVAQSDNPQFAAFVRSGYSRRYLRHEALVIVQRSSEGFTQVFSHKKSGVSLTEAIKLIRIAEMGRYDVLVLKDSDADLTAEKSQQCPNWYLHPKGGMILNGSLTIKDVTPSRLTLKQIGELVVKSLALVS